MFRGKSQAGSVDVAVAGAPLDLKRDALERILNSRTFANRARLRQFLSFVAEAALAGRSAELKEHALAISVFGRQSDQFTGDDNIVRVTARQLRAKITEYYLTEGKEDPWRVDIPRGTYVPVFLEAAEAPLARNSEPPPAVSPRLRRRFRTDWLVAAATGALLSLALAAAWNSHLQVQRTTVLGLMQPEPDRRVLIVCADAAMQFYKSITGSAPVLADYQRHMRLGKTARSPGERRALEWIEDARLFGIGNVSTLAKLIPAFHPGTVLVRHPRQVTDRDFVDDNVILLSGPFANPWAQLFEPKLNFQVTADANGDVYIRNVRPQPGELPAYRTNESDENRRTYCRVAFLRNFSGRGRVLLIGGPSASAELISTWLADPAFYQELQHRLGVTGGSEAIPTFEVLVEATEVSGTPVSLRLVCVRRAG
ncbi:MAG: hypothetical protein M1541_07170 [Acidobacteria bacterium]|nr:hypothetical protein [Acidobacteriota bacterium]